MTPSYDVNGSSNNDRSSRDGTSTDETCMFKKKLPRATLKQKIEVLDYLAGPPQRSQIEALGHYRRLGEFAISQATLSNWATHEDKIREEFDRNPNLNSYKKIPVLKYPEINDKVEKHISILIEEGIKINNKIIKDTYIKFMKEEGLDVSDFKLSTGMLKSFKKRNLNHLKTKLDASHLGASNSSEQKTDVTEHALPFDNHQIHPRDADLQLNTISETIDLDLDDFDKSFNDTTVGLSTKLIHSGDAYTPNSNDVFTFNPSSLDYSNQLFNLPVTLPQLQTSPPAISNKDAPQSKCKELSSISNILPNPLPTKHKLPYYPTYKNPLNDSHAYSKRHHNTTSNANFVGSKNSNPNSEKIEKILENITNGYVTLYNSGTSAIMGILSNINPDNVFIDDEGYQGTHDVIGFLNKLTNVKKFPLSSLDASSTIPSNSVMIIESPMNPLGYVHDISHYSKICKSGNNGANCKLIVDSTLAPPPLQEPFKNGADYIVYSAVKYLAGVSDLSAGFVVSKDKPSKISLHNERMALGTSIANFDSFLLLRSLRTYKMRILTQCNNAEKIIKFLLKNQIKYKNVLAKIHHASLQENGRIVMEQLNDYYNPVFALELREPSYPDKLLHRFNFLSNNPNLEGGETLVELIYGNNKFISEVDNYKSLKNYKKMLRFSVGCEDFQDIIRDIDQALTGLMN